MTQKEMYVQSLDSLSPTDGREIIFTAPLRQYLSEGALHRYRAMIMIKNIIALSEAGFPRMPEINNEERIAMHVLIDPHNFDSSCVAEYDHFSRNGIGPLEHDVKAVETYLRELFDANGLGYLKEW